MEGLRNPALYAEVMVEVYQLILADPDANPNFNTALMRLAENGGGGKLEVIPKEFGNFNPKFFPEHASKKVHMVDLPFQKTEHGALIHIVQDLVVNKALAERGMTSVEFRELLGKCEDWVTSDTFEPTTRDHPKAIRVGDMLWQETYDSTAEDASHMNTPEDVFPILRDMFGLH
jgi:hypothetical protein